MHRFMVLHRRLQQLSNKEPTPVVTQLILESNDRLQDPVDEQERRLSIERALRERNERANRAH